MNAELLNKIYAQLLLNLTDYTCIITTANWNKKFQYPKSIPTNSELNLNSERPNNSLCSNWRVVAWNFT